jgi:hypothetical protein
MESSKAKEFLNSKYRTEEFKAHVAWAAETAASEALAEIKANLYSNRAQIRESRDVNAIIEKS